MAGVKGNRRTLYSKMVIRDSLIKLLQDNEIHNITVTDICKEADINRGTFYNYYSDPFDLLQSIEDELFDKILEYLSEDYLEENKIDVLTKIFELGKENKDLCKILLFKQGDSRILNRVLYIIDNHDIIKFDSKLKYLDKKTFNYMMRFAITGSMGVIKAWLENDLAESPNEIAHIVDNITKRIFCI